MQSAATTATTPESMVNKTFSDDEEPYQRRYKKPPIGGIAVLPLIDSKKIDDRKSPVDRVGSRSPPYGVTYDPSSTYRTSYTEEVSVNLTQFDSFSSPLLLCNFSSHSFCMFSNSKFFCFFYFCSCISIPCI